MRDEGRKSSEQRQQSERRKKSFTLESVEFVVVYVSVAGEAQTYLRERTVEPQISFFSFRRFPCLQFTFDAKDIKTFHTQVATKPIENKKKSFLSWREANMRFIM